LGCLHAVGLLRLGTAIRAAGGLARLSVTVGALRPILVLVPTGLGGTLLIPRSLLLLVAGRALGFVLVPVASGALSPVLVPVAARAPALCGGRHAAPDLGRARGLAPRGEPCARIAHRPVHARTCLAPRRRARSTCRETADASPGHCPGRRRLVLDPFFRPVRR